MLNDVSGKEKRALPRKTGEYHPIFVLLALYLNCIAGFTCLIVLAIMGIWFAQVQPVPNNDPKQEEIRMDLVAVLKRCEVFMGLCDSDLEKVAALSSWRRNTYSQDEIIFQENIVAKDLYILEEGEVRLFIQVHNKGSKGVTQVPVDNITAGDIFGWSSLVAPHSLTLTAICVKPSSVSVVIGAELNALMDSDHSLGYEVMKGLVRVIGARLRDLRGRFVSEHAQLPKGYDIHIE